MTTQVKVYLPTPNHKRVKVTAHYVNEDGSLGAVVKEKILEHGQMSNDHEFFVHSTCKLVIEEVD